MKNDKSESNNIYLFIFLVSEVKKNFVVFYSRINVFDVFTQLRSSLSIL